MVLVIQRATINDLDTLYKIEKECFVEEAFTKGQIAHLIESPNTISLIARMNNEIAGFIIGLIHDKIGHVCTIDVATKYRRMGIGLRLLDELERRLAERGVKLCLLEARLDNVAAQGLYRKRGYTEVEMLKNYYSKGVHGVRFVKKLAKAEPRNLRI